MTNTKLFLKRWGPALLVMAAIFAASSRTNYELPNFGRNDLWVKKLGHLCIYATLAWTYVRGLAFDGRPLTWRSVVLAVAAAGLYGATDEYHQSFVPGRGPAWLDVAIDTTGALLGAVAAAAWRWRRASSSKELGRAEDNGGLG